MGRPARPGPPHRLPGPTATCTATRPPTWPPSPTTTPTGGPEHALVALVDHNIGITKDVFVGGPAERILDQVRQMCAERRADLVPRPRTRPGCAARWPGTWRSPTTSASCPRRARSPPTGRWSAPGWPCCPRRPARRRRPAAPAAHRPTSAPDWSGASSARPEAARFGLDAVGRRRAGLAALLPGPAARPRGELPGRRPDAVEPGGGRAVPARLGAPAGRAGHGRRGDAAPGAARLGGVRGPAAGAAGAGGHPDRRGDRGDGAGVRPALHAPASGAARPRRRWPS